MYATSAQSMEKIIIEHVDAVGNPEEEYPKESEHDEEQESEYDTESESELPPTVNSDQEDNMTFLQAVTTRSGLTVRIASKLF